MATDPNAAQYEQQAASGTGIPVNVTHQQALAESGEQDTATSGAGAEGFWQFLPSTYNAYAAQAGVPVNTEYNAADETKVYIVFMNSLLKQEGGNIFKALEAYNAGPGNLSAGSGYAAGIESRAGVSQSATAGSPGAQSSATASTTACVGPTVGGICLGVPIPGNTSGASILDPNTWITDLANAALSALGLGSFKDLFQRLGLILLGVALLIVGISILSKGGGVKQPINITTQSTTDETGATTKTRQVRSPVSRHTKTVRSSAPAATASKSASRKGLAADAIEAAAVA